MIIASICSIPDRLNSLITVLENIKSQSIKPDILYVSISKYYPRSKKLYSEEILFSLKSYLDTYSIPNKLIIYENDIGPTLKLVTPLRFHTYNPEDFIFTFDDDTPLYEKTIETLLLAHNKDRNAVYALSGARQNKFFHAEMLPEDYSYFEIDIVGGYRGVLYPVYLIDKSALFKWIDMFVNTCAKNKSIPMHDDHIFSYYFKHQNIPRRVSNSPFSKKFNYTTIPNEDGIFKDENTIQNMDLINNTLYEKELNWVVDNPI
jgi:hypothetical protein